MPSVEFLIEVCDEVDELLRSEHHFRSELRHVQTDMVPMMMAIESVKGRVDGTLDDEDGTPRGIYVNIPEREERR